MYVFFNEWVDGNKKKKATIKGLLRGRGSNVKFGQCKNKLSNYVKSLDTLLFYIFTRSHLWSSSLHLFDKMFNIL